MLNRMWNKPSHDRWQIVDDKLYHCGHSLNANGGHKISAITLLGPPPRDYPRRSGVTLRPWTYYPRPLLAATPR